MLKCGIEALTQNEVEELSTNPTNDGLVLHYDFEGGSVKDRSELVMMVLPLIVN